MLDIDAIRERAVHAVVRLNELHVEALDCSDYDALIESTRDTSALCDEAERLRREADKYKTHSEAINALHSCNDCADAKWCTHRPKLGAWARINCFLWSSGEPTKEVSGDPDGKGDGT